MADILHNIGDHAKTALAVINEANIDAEFKDRLFKHILLEEQENTKRLEELAGSEDSNIVKIALDHSFFIQKFVSGNQIQIEMQKSLLSHFLEEHEAFLNVNSNTGGPKVKQSPVTTPVWTVGPMTID